MKTKFMETANLVNTVERWILSVSIVSKVSMKFDDFHSLIVVGTEVCSPCQNLVSPVVGCFMRRLGNVRIFIF